jgi:hypothetical protein
VLLILNNRINDCRFVSRTLQLSKSEIHFSAFSNEYIKAPAEIAREDKNPMALLTEVMQTTYIVTTLAIILNNKRTMPDEMEMIIIK